VKFADEFYFAAPKGMLSPDEIPWECGLIEISEDGSTRIRLKPPRPAWNAPKKPSTLPRGLMAALLRKFDPSHVNSDLSRDLGAMKYKLLRAKRLASDAKFECDRARKHLQVV